MDVFSEQTHDRLTGVSIDLPARTFQFDPGPAAHKNEEYYIM